MFYRNKSQMKCKVKKLTPYGKYVRIHLSTYILKLINKN